MLILLTVLFLPSFAAPPPIMITPSQATVQLGTPLTLTCRVTSTRAVAFTWRVGGVDYTQDQDTGRVRINTAVVVSTLTLVTVDEGDVGNVSCEARDPIHLPVTIEAVLTESSAFYIYGASDQRSVSLQLDNPFRLDCDVRGGGGVSTVTWFKGRQVIGDGNDGLTVLTFPNGTSSLVRATTRREDSGRDYLCKAEMTGVDSSLTQQFNIFVFSELEAT